jgi:hypothetical protein
VLKPKIVGAAVDRDRLAARRHVLLELDLLIAQLERRGPYTGAEHAGQIVEIAVADHALVDLSEAKRLLIEGDRRFEVGYGQRKAANLPCSGEHRAREQR